MYKNIKHIERVTLIYKSPEEDKKVTKFILDGKYRWIYSGPKSMSKSGFDMTKAKVIIEREIKI